MLKKETSGFFQGCCRIPGKGSHVENLNSPLLTVSVCFSQNVLYKWCKPMSRWLPWSESTISLTGDAMLYIVSTCSGFAYSGARVALSSRAEDILGKEQGKMFSVFKGFSAFLYFAVHLHTHVPWHMSGGQRTAFRSWYFPSTMWVPGTKSRSACLTAAGAPTRGAISWALFSSFQSMIA